MLSDGRQIERDTLLEADLCVVGGGAAGITTALELLGSSRSVVLLESAAYGYDQRSQKLYVGDEGGTYLRPDSEYLTSTRLRHFGGTTGHWGGWCRPLDGEDFARRPWVDPSGWPITRDQLDPYYERAARILRIHDFDDAADASGEPLLLPPEAAFETTFMHVNPLRFATAYGPMLRRASNVHVVMNANLRQIGVDEAARRVTGLEVVTLSGNRFRVRAGAYVLAAGGIENARLLLASNHVAAAGLGNQHDLVGRYFMEHPLVQVGHLVSCDQRFGRLDADTYSSRGGSRRGGRMRGALRLRPELQRRHGILNALVFLWRITPAEFPELAPQVARLAGELAGIEVRRIPCWRVGIATEQRPNPESHVRLTGERDALGMPRVRLDWRISEQDADTVRITTELLTAELGATLASRLRLPPARDAWAGWNWSKHHMGTTRMDTDPRRGVVDADCRVHGLANLWIAGSSVFSNSGCSNPTLTIVALSVRLARHLDRLLG